MASEMNINALNTRKTYDFFVLYDENDDHAKQQILPELDKENLSVCTLQGNVIPGNLIFDAAFELVARSKRVLCVVSKLFTRNNLFKCMIQSACSTPIIGGRIITLLTDGEITPANGLFCLRHAPCIKFDNDWVLNLKAELVTIIPEYCIYQANRGTSSIAFSKGLMLQLMDINMYGVLIRARNKNFLVDMSEFSRHLDKHAKFKVSQACEDCGFLCDLNTTISLGFTDDFILGENAKFGETDLSKGLLDLMKSVMDAYNPHSKSNLWSVSCSVTGEYKPSHANYINDMFGSVVYALLNRAASKMQVPFLPEYEDIQKRRESMTNVVTDDLKKEAAVAAGFVCIAEPDRMQCFQCGWHIPLSAMDLEPLMYHASYMPLCPFIQKTLSSDRLPQARVHHKKFDNSELSTEDNGDEDFQRFADAGFYRNGFEHIIECISCGLCIIYNNANTSPWDTHALLSPTCKFVLEKKGKDFVKSVNAQRATDKEPTIITYALTDFSFNHRTEWPGILFTPDTI